MNCEFTLRWDSIHLRRAPVNLIQLLATAMPCIPPVTQLNPGHQCCLYTHHVLYMSLFAWSPTLTSSVTYNICLQLKLYSALMGNEWTGRWQVCEYMKFTMSCICDQFGLTHVCMQLCACVCEYVCVHVFVGPCAVCLCVLLAGPVGVSERYQLAYQPFFEHPSSPTYN